MPVASNRYYNDPALGQAFANLADAFAPPSGSDASGYATAAATKDAASRLAWLFNNPTDPTASKRSSLTGVQEFGNTPEGYTYNVDTNATTLRRGQDVAAATDITNNKNTVLGNTITGLYDNLAPGDTRAAVPAEVAATIGLPAVPATAGTPKPLSETELKAAILGDLPKADQNASVLSEIPVETVGSGKIVRRSDAVGQDAYVPPTAETVRNYKTGDGKVGTAIIKDGKLFDSQTGAVLPAGTLTFSASLQGGGAETNLGPTAANITAGNNLNASLDGAEYTANQMKAILAKNPNASGVPARIKGLAQSITSSAKQVIAAYAKEAPDAAITLDEARKKLDEYLGGGTGYDPDVVNFASGIFDLAYARAQIANPTGEVSRQAFDRALESFGGSWWGSQQDSVAGLDAFLSTTVPAGRVRAKSLLQQSDGAAPATPDAPPAAEAPITATNPTTGEKMQFVNGQWVPM